ncbi:MAG: hypothetical protein IKB86_05250 [Clostridia bacterium]|nr:hypothetical protein [Clostridia bacterium]
MDENGHLKKFDGQSSILMSEASYRRFYRGQEYVGRSPDENNPLGSNYISTSADIDKALNECHGNISELENSLGLPPRSLGDGPIIRVDINNPEEHGLRIANGREPGANEYYNTPLDENGKLPDIKYADADRKIVDTAKTNPAELAKLNGQYWDQNGCYHPPNMEGYQGKTSGGLDEAVVNQIPNTPQNISYTRYEGFKRNENSDISSCKLTDGYSSDSYKFNPDDYIPKTTGIDSSGKGLGTGIE